MTKRPPEQPADPAPSQSRWSPLILTFVFVINGLYLYQKTKSAPAKPAVGTSRIVTQPDSRSSIAPAPQTSNDARTGAGQLDAPQKGTARLNLAAEDGTAELQLLFGLWALTEADFATYGIPVATSGTDLFAAKIRIDNTGDVPVRVYPQNIRVHYAHHTAGVSTIAHSSFLQASVLQPHQNVSGLVIYRATLAVGAAMRTTADGRISYKDSSITVTYEQRKP